MSRERTKQLQGEFAARRDPLGWFDALYREAAGDASVIPWADLRDNPQFLAWRARSGIDLRSRSSLVVGCGLGDDAETVAASGGEVTAFDLSATAIEWCRRRFPQSRVRYVAADLFHAPAAWQRAFGFVLEINTLQALPADLRPDAIARVADFVAPDGTLLVICRGRDAGDPVNGPPWPLVRGELEGFRAAGLDAGSVDIVVDDADPPVRRFVAVFTRSRQPPGRRVGTPR
jgi:SAM-dependent methyltransferase